MELFKLFGTISINSDDAKQNIDDVTQTAKSAGETLQTVGSAVSGFGDTLSKGITAPAVAAGTAVFAFATKSASTADNIDKMSQKIGISREAYQELDFICSQSGTTVDGLQMGMKSLTAAMDGAVSGTKSNVEQFEKLGVSVTNADGSLRNQEDVLFDTLNALQNMENQTEKSRLATELFGRSGTELMPLLNGASGSIDEMKQQAHDLGLVMSNEGVNAGVAFTDKMDQVKRSFTATAAEAGTKLLPYLTELGDTIIEKGIPAFEKLIDKVTSVVNWFTSLDEGTQQTILTIAGIVVALGPALSIIGRLITFIGSVTSAAQKLFTVLMANPIALVIAAIVALVAGFIYLWNTSEEFRQFWIDLWEGIKTVVSTVIDAVVGFFTSLWDSVVEVFTAIGETVSSAWETISTTVSDTLTGIGEGISSAWEGFKTTVSNGMTAIHEGMSTAWENIKTVTSNAWNNMKNNISTVVNAVKSVVSSVFNAVKSVVSSIWSGISSLTSSYWNAMKNNISNTVNGIKTVVTTVFNAVKSVVTTVWNGIKTAITTPIENAKDKIKSMVDAIKGFFSGLQIKLPHIALPHFSVSGTLSIAPPSVPHLSIEWYKKAMDEPYMFTRPTVFGLGGSLKGAGEAGDEIMYGKQNLLNDIQNATGGVAVQEKLNKIIDLLESITGMQIRLDTNALVGGLAPAMDTALGGIWDAQERGGRTRW